MFSDKIFPFLTLYSKLALHCFVFFFYFFLPRVPLNPYLDASIRPSLI
jgi:hypothetical protein